MKIAILGAGTLAAFIIDIAQRISHLKVMGQFDDRFPEITQSNGLPVLGRMDDAGPDLPLVLGIGDPAVRKVVFEKKASQGFKFQSIIDPSCVISGTARIEDGVIVGPISSVLCGSVIGCGACLLSHVNVNQNVHVGSFALIGAGVVIGNDATIGQGAHLGLGCTIPLGGNVGDWTHVQNR